MGPLLLSRVLELNDVQEGVFFFSSRRRHTRCGHDWSSDVCSSDLIHCSCKRRKRSFYRKYVQQYGSHHQNQKIQKRELHQYFGQRDYEKCRCHYSKIPGGFIRRGSYFLIILNFMKFNPQQAIQHLEYNTDRQDLVIPEYGRHLQKLIDQVILIENREERNKAARTIIDIMGTINPHLRDVLDFQHKLWDQLFKMSRFELDVDSPYPKPQPEWNKNASILIDYPLNNQDYRFYGNHIVEMIKEAVSWEESEKKTALIMVIANHMKKSYMTWNKDTVSDEVIFTHLFDLSEGKIDLRNLNNDTSNTVNLTAQSPRANYQNRTNTGKSTFQRNNNQKNTQSNYSGNPQKRFVKKNNNANNGNTTNNISKNPNNRKAN